MKSLGSKPGTHGIFRFRTELAQSRVTVEIRVGPARGLERIALDLVIGHGVGEDDVVFRYGQGLVAGDLAGLQLDIEERPGGSHQAMLRMQSRFPNQWPAAVTTVA